MADFLRGRLLWAWLLLIVLTVISWWTATAGGGHAYEANAVVSFGVLAMAALKSRIVIMEYMEVRSAPRWLQRACDGWLLGVFAMIAIFYVIG
jgi:hypothetical protein